MSTSSAAGLTVRPMRGGDLDAAEQVTAEGLEELGGDPHTADRPLPTRVERRDGAREGARAERRRMEHLLDHDPGGCWVAETPAGIVGLAASMRRDLTWILATFAVRSGLQGQGIGRQLLEASLSHGRGCLRGMLAAPSDPGAARRYRLAGFSLHPTMDLTGPVDRSLLPVVERVREGTAGDIDLMNSVDRQVRDAAHGVDHELLTRMYRLAVVDRTTGSGYVYVSADGSPHLLAATNRRTATDLLWEALASSQPGTPCTVGHVTAANEWAVDVGLAARLPLRTSGYLGLRQMRPPMPYLPSRHFL